MKETPFSVDFDNEEETFALKDTLFKYLRYWPWFLISLAFFISLGILYLQYAPISYESVAKIKILDESKEMNVATDALSLLNSTPKINMENETEVLKSYRLLARVVEELNLDVSYHQKGNIKSTQIYDAPFIVTKDISEDSLGRPKSFNVRLNIDNVEITNEDEQVRKFKFSQLDTILPGLPFKLSLSPSLDITEYLGIDYNVVLKSKKQTVYNLVNELRIQPTGKNSDIISLALNGESFKRSEAILNTLIKVFNTDGIVDRQQVSKRTLDFIDERFVYLSTELDSIEGGKENFKRANSLSYIEVDAETSLERKSETENDVADLETQISLSNLLKKTVINQAAYSLLPVDIGLENNSLNKLVSNYNELSLERENLVLGVGEKHPSLVALSERLERTKQNVLETVEVYQTRLKTELERLNREQTKANTVFSRLPEKEKMLRAIERQQSIKENLFLLLLQKREEAAINLAVTVPSVKVVDYAQTKNQPVSPGKSVVLVISGLFGMFLPFAFLFIKTSLDTKITDSTDLEKLLPAIPIAAEIPHLKNKKIFLDINDNSEMAESFRILASNLSHLLPKEKSPLGKVVFMTSSVEEEGKSLLAYNLSVAMASLNKKVLLVGADLRKPTLHEFIRMNIQTKGLADFLHNPEHSVEDFIYPGLEKSSNHKICLSGPIPPNAPLLLSSPGFEKFITSVKDDYDYIILDTAPLTSVTDTLLISEHADIALCVARAGFTDKKLMKKFGDSKQSGIFKNVALVLNDMKIEII